MRPELEATISPQVNQKALNKPLPLEFAKAFDLAQNQLDFRFAIGFGWRLAETINFPMKRAMKASCRILDQYAYFLIDERASKRSQKDGDKHGESDQRDLLDLVMAARDDHGSSLGRTQLRDTVLNLIVAGRDTTAQALSWAFFHALMNRDLIAKIRAETNEIVGAADEDQERVTYENYKRFTWSYATFLETLRLHPSLPKNAKTALANDQIPGGPTIEAGDMVRWSDWQMGRDSRIWGPDCGEFLPDRWIDEMGRIKNYGPYKFHAFNAGPRICLGVNLAIFEAIAMIVNVFNDFDLEFAPGWWKSVPKSKTLEGVTSRYQTPLYKSSLSLPMSHPMIISVQHRKH